MTETLSFGLPAHAVEALGVFQEWPQIQRVLLYGLRAKGSYRAGSDIDLTIEGEELSLTQLLAIGNQIDDLLLPWMVDISLKHQIDNSALLEHIARGGVAFSRG